MLYSVEWLRDLCPTAESDARLAEALTSRGLTVDSVETGPHGTTLDVDVPANRPDCLGHLGIARELSAALGARLAVPPPPPTSRERADWVRVEIDDSSLCSRYTAGLAREVRVAPSPAWVVRRIEACGLRSISNVVDASNLVLLALGQPIHFFDFDRLRADAESATIRVRPAGASETLTTLDGVARRLDPETLVIADRSRPVALAGILGGSETEIHGGTRRVLIEAAHFRRQSVRRTSRRLDIRTDASFRFERGVDATAIPAAQELALRLLAQFAGARPEPVIVDCYPAPAPPREVRLELAELHRLLGYSPELPELLAALTALGLDPRADGDGAWRTRIPGWRTDLEREADLVEEVARHLGYDRIPIALGSFGAPSQMDPLALVERRARELLAQRGFHEAIGYAMIATGEDAPFVAAAAGEPLRLTNPIAEPLAQLRRSLLPGLVRAVDLNQRRGSTDVRLFEVGRVFLAGTGGGRPAEPSRLGLVWSGAAVPRHWSAPPREVDLFDLTGAVEQLVHALAPTLDARRTAGGPAAFHPGASASWTDAGGQTLAWGGLLHPEIQARFESPVFLAELELEALARVQGAPAQYSEIPRYPSVARDLSLVVPGEVAFAEILATLRATDPPAAVEFSAIDRYRGAPLGPDEVALTVRFTLRPPDRTLTDAETERYRLALLDRLRLDLGIRLRA